MMPTETLGKTIETQSDAIPDSPLTIDMMIQAADEAGIRLEYIQGIGGIWEVMPRARHQANIFRIQTSIKLGMQTTAEGGGCFHYSDVSMRFPDGSAKRPDIAIFCTEPEQDEEITVLPDAVIELVSPGYADKDYNVAVPFYKKWGIRDIVIFDPKSGDVLHINAEGETHYASPVTLTFACGCVCTV
jgi:Uma2 family endonuclease